VKTVKKTKKNLKVYNWICFESLMNCVISRCGQKGRQITRYNTRMLNMFWCKEQFIINVQCSYI